MSGVEPTCPTCTSFSPLIKTEKRGGLEYRIHRCPKCRTVFCPDHHSDCSPDYVGKNTQDINHTLLWCQGEHKLHAYKQLFNKLETSGRPIRSLLDIGCGTGGFLDYAASKGVTLRYGYDASAAQAEVARERHPNTRQAVSLTDYLNDIQHYTDFDLITLWDVVEHLRAPRQLFADIVSNCSRSAILFLSTPNATSEYLKFQVKNTLGLTHTFVPWEHVIYFSRQALEQTASDFGFNVIFSGAASCYRRPVTLAEVGRRFGYALAAHTSLMPQLFLLCSGDQGPKELPHLGRTLQTPAQCRHQERVGSGLPREPEKSESASRRKPPEIPGIPL